MGPGGSCSITQPILIGSYSNFAWINLRWVPMGPEFFKGTDGSWWILTDPDWSWGVQTGPDGSWWFLMGPDGSWWVLFNNSADSNRILLKFTWISLRWVPICPEVFIGPDGSWQVLMGPDRSNFNNSANSNQNLLKFCMDQHKMGPNGSWWVLFNNSANYNQIWLKLQLFPRLEWTFYLQSNCLSLSEL